MSLHPGPQPTAFAYDPATARLLIDAASTLADATDDLRGAAGAGRGDVESREFAGTTATEVRARHDDLDATCRLLATALADQVAELEAEIATGVDRAAAAEGARRRWRDDLLAWQEAGP